MKDTNDNRDKSQWNLNSYCLEIIAKSRENQVKNWDKNTHTHIIKNKYMRINYPI